MQPIIIILIFVALALGIYLVWISYRIINFLKNILKDVEEIKEEIKHFEIKLQNKLYNIFDSSLTKKEEFNFLKETPSIAVLSKIENYLEKYEAITIQKIVNHFRKNIPEQLVINTLYRLKNANKIDIDGLISDPETIIHHNYNKSRK